MRAPRGKSVECRLSKERSMKRLAARDSSRMNYTRVRTSLGSARIDTVRTWTLYHSSLVRALVRLYVR